ncbi:MAG TPA: hypothetical protein VIX63_07090 [Vicinamibacterales bacterium]
MTQRRRTLATVLVALAIVAAQEVSRRALAAALEASDFRAPERLSGTGLEKGRLFSPQYPLWSDGAAKKRWVYLPPGSTIDATDVNAWDFPVGTRFWKEFTFGGRKVETRFLWKASSDRWVFASYQWNENGTDAVRAPEEGVPAAAGIGGGRSHSIPSTVECRACHDSRRTEILGFNALQLSIDRDPNAIHGEPLAPGMVTLETLADERRLSPARTDLVANPPRIKAQSAATRAVLGYMTANCGACHNGDGELAAPGPSLKHGDVADGDRVARSLVRQPTAWQVPGLAEGAGMFVDPDAPQSSAILTRMRSRRPSSQMPPVGTVVPDREAIDAIARWIATDLQRSRLQ